VVIASGAKQSDEVVARAKPVAISRVPSLRSGQGFVATLLAMTCGWTFYDFINFSLFFKKEFVYRAIHLYFKKKALFLRLFLLKYLSGIILSRHKSDEGCLRIVGETDILYKGLKLEAKGVRHLPAGSKNLGF